MITSRCHFYLRLSGGFFVNLKWISDPWEGYILIQRQIGHKRTSRMKMNPMDTIPIFFEFEAKPVSICVMVVVKYVSGCSPEIVRPKVRNSVSVSTLSRLNGS